MFSELMGMADSVQEECDSHISLRIDIELSTYILLALTTFRVTVLLYCILDTDADPIGMQT